MVEKGVKDDSLGLFISDTEMGRLQVEQVWGELQEFRHPSGDAEQALG